MTVDKNARRKLKGLRTYAAVLLMAGMFLCLSMGAQAASKKWTNACKAYNEFLAGNVSSFVPLAGDFGTRNQESYEKTAAFQIADLNQDGIPELITFRYISYKHEKMYIFTCENNEVVRVKDIYTNGGGNGEIAEGLVAIKDAPGSEAGIDLSYNAAGSYTTYVCGRGHLHTEWIAWAEGHDALKANVYMLKNGRLEAFMYGYRSYLGTRTTLYRINGETVAEGTYDAEIEKCKAAGIKNLCENTAANRASILAAGTDTGQETDTSSIRLSQTSIVLNKGKSFKLKLTGTEKKPKWKSSKKSVATVSKNGRVKAKKAGTTKITATLNGKKYKCKVTVENPRLNKKKITLKAGTKSRLKMKGTSQKVTWKSSKPSVASVNQNGVVKAKKKGNTTITAKVSGKTVKCKVIVKKAAKSIRLNKSKLTLNVGKSAKLKATVVGKSKKVKWKSSNPAVATVNAKGKVTAKKEGTAKITARANGVKASCKVTVKDGTSRKIVAVSLGRSTSAVLTSTGELWTFGANYDGQLGDGTTTNRHTPVKIMDDVASVSCGGNCTAAIKTDGSLWMWGGNSVGQLGTGDTVSRLRPVKIMDDVAVVSCGAEQSAAIKTDGSLWTWGYNYNGQLGDGTTTDRHTPVRIMDDVTDVSLGRYNGAAIKKDGSLWVWGSIILKGKGIETRPVRLLTDVASVSLKGYHEAAVKKDGSLWTWGYNSHGELGTGDRVFLDEPVQVLTGVRQACVGGIGNNGDMGIEEGHTAALMTDGSLWIWGCNQYGRLGIGKESSDEITKTKLMTGVTAVSLGGFHSAAIKTDGSLWMWGRNISGQLGDGTTTNRLSPVQITLPD